MIVSTIHCRAHPAPQADPVIGAVCRHRAAFDAYQAALEGEPSLVTNEEYDAATEALVSTPCITRFGAGAMLAHLRWWLAEEAEFAAGHQLRYRLAQVRAADLTLLFEPSRNLAAGAATELRRPPSHQHRLDQADEILAALIIVIGGTIAAGVATLV